MHQHSHYNSVVVHHGRLRSYAVNVMDVNTGDNIFNLPRIIERYGDQYPLHFTAQQGVLIDSTLALELMRTINPSYTTIPAKCIVNKKHLLYPFGIFVTDVSQLNAIIKHFKHSITSAVSVLDKNNYTRAERDAVRLSQRKLVSDIDWDNVSVLSLDFEAYEFNQKFVTEIGITHRAKGGSIVTRHIVVDEHKQYRNGVYVNDNRDNYTFGVTEVLPLQQCVQLLTQLIDGVDYVLAHGIRNELAYLTTMGVDYGEGMQSRLLDTSTLCYDAIPDKRTASLTQLLQLYGIEHSDMHNAGNDSAYTLQLFDKIVSGV